MRALLVPGISGLVFGLGLVIGGMTRSDKVVAFLDVTGDWDPSLAFVMGGAILVHFLAYRLVPRMKSPLDGGRWGIPTRRDIDTRLLAGAAVFGAGWGLAGYCPGPAIAALGTGGADALVVLGGTLAGMLLYQVVEKVWLDRPAPTAAPAPARPVEAAHARPVEAASSK